MNTATRTIIIGKKIVLVTNVPTQFSDDEVKTFVLMKFFEMNKKQAVEEMTRSQRAS
jgi:hypothetical protein